MTEPEVRERLLAARRAELEKAAIAYEFHAASIDRGKHSVILEKLLATAYEYGAAYRTRLGTPCDNCPWVSEVGRKVFNKEVKEAARRGDDFVCQGQMTRCWGAFLYGLELPAPASKGMSILDLAGAAEAIGAAHGDLEVECRGSDGEPAPLLDIRAERRKDGKKGAKVVLFLDSELPD